MDVNNALAKYVRKVSIRKIS